MPLLICLVGSSEICANTYKQTNSVSKASQKQEQIDEHIHTSVWAGDVCTFQVKTIRNRWHFHNVLCVQSSPVLHHDVWTGGNKWNPVSAALFFSPAIHVSSVICPACPRLFFWRFYSFIPVHLILPVMTAELPSLCFHAGPVHRDEWSVSRRMIDTGGAGGSRTAWSRENAAPLDDRGGIW